MRKGIREKNYKCLYCGFNSTDVNDVKSHEEYLHGCFRDKNPRKLKFRKPKPTLKDSIIVAKCLPIRGSDFKIDVRYDLYSDGSHRMFTDDTRYGDNQEIIFDKEFQQYTIKNLYNLKDKSESIEYKPSKYVFDKDGKPTTKIDINKVTKRLVYGDDEFRTEKDMCGKKAFNGNKIDGVILKLSSGWLDRKVSGWKNRDKDSREYRLYLNYKSNRDIYLPNLSSKQSCIKYLIPLIREEGYKLPTSILYECIFECFNEKFGVGESKQESSYEVLSL